MDGVRLSDGEYRSWAAKPGEYGRVLRDGRWVWCGVTPNGLAGDFSGHSVEEHSDGSISVSPSIRVDAGAGLEWHGYLEHGVWREC